MNGWMKSLKYFINNFVLFLVFVIWVSLFILQRFLSMVYGTRSSSNVQKNLDYTEMQLRSILQSRSFYGNYLVDAIKDLRLKHRKRIMKIKRELKKYEINFYTYKKFSRFFFVSTPLNCADVNKHKKLHTLQGMFVRYSRKKFSDK